jgi:hypothetical protein
MSQKAFGTKERETGRVLKKPRSQGLLFINQERKFPSSLFVLPTEKNDVDKLCSFFLRHLRKKISFCFAN